VNLARCKSGPLHFDVLSFRHTTITQESPVTNTYPEN
jgi:hypothetical protein